MNVNLNLLSVQEKFLNFKANNSHGATNKNENVNVMTTRKKSFDMNVSQGPLRYTSDVINSALQA